VLAFYRSRPPGARDVAGVPRVAAPGDPTADRDDAGP